MFKKNSMEFFIGLDYYLYYFTVAVLLLVHDHMLFQNVLWSPDLVTWPDFLSSHAIYILIPLYDLRFLLWEPQTGKRFPYIWTLNPKPQSIQWSKDIKRVGTQWVKITWQGQVIIEHSGKNMWSWGFRVQPL